MNIQELNKVRALIERRNGLIEDLSLINQHTVSVIAKESAASLQFEKIELKKEKESMDSFQKMMFTRLMGEGMIKVEAPEIKLKTVKTIHLEETLLLKLVSTIRDHVKDQLSEINQELITLGLEL